jgi:hypothetical protein
MNYLQLSHLLDDVSTRHKNELLCIGQKFTCDHQLSFTAKTPNARIDVAGIEIEYVDLVPAARTSSAMIRASFSTSVLAHQLLGERGLCLLNMGMMIPNIGMSTKHAKRTAPSSGNWPPGAAISGTGLADALFTTTQQRVLGFLFGQPDRSFFASELIGLARIGSGGVQRELKRLADSG